MSEPTDPLGYLGSLIRRAQQRHVAIWQAEVSTEMTSVQFAALTVVKSTGPISQRELGDALDVDRSTVADLVSRLVRNGMLSRSGDPSDGRRYVLALTPAGEQAIAELWPKVASAQLTLAADITPTEAHQLKSLLQRVVDGPAPTSQ